MLVTDSYSTRTRGVGLIFDCALSEWACGDGRDCLSSSGRGLDLTAAPTFEDLFFVVGHNLPRVAETKPAVHLLRIHAPLYAGTTERCQHADRPLVGCEHSGLPQLVVWCALIGGVVMSRTAVCGHPGSGLRPEEQGGCPRSPRLGWSSSPRPGCCHRPWSSTVSLDNTGADPGPLP